MPTETPDPAADLSTLIPPARAGDPAARNELVRRAQARLERLTRRMLRGYPGVGRWVESGDVFQTATMRLLVSLEATPVADTRGFFHLATAVIRRELIDLARHFQGPHGLGANHASRGGAVPETAAADPDPAELDRWAALHEAAGRLPAADREVFGLTFYHGWTQAEIGGQFGIDERTVRRRLRRAVEALQAAVGGDLPGG